MHYFGSDVTSTGKTLLFKFCYTWGGGTPKPHTSLSQAPKHS